MMASSSSSLHGVPIFSWSANLSPRIRPRDVDDTVGSYHSARMSLPCAEHRKISHWLGLSDGITLDCVPKILYFGTDQERATTRRASGAVQADRIGGIVSRKPAGSASRAAESRMRRTPLKFIDLFAGLGGFHLALSQLGHRCVFASELDTDLAALYEKNFCLKPAGDIRQVELDDIPKHDVLCAGFPCQPFSKAGEQRGLRCPQWGDLIDYVIAILESHKPQFFIIENVPNLVRHNHGRTWKKIKSRLQEAGYEIDDSKLSPHMFGIPQIRERAFIIGRRGRLNGFRWPDQKQPATKLSIRAILDRNPPEARKLPAHFIEYLNAWQHFLDHFPKDEELPSFPIWAMEFGATYPYTQRAPYASRFKKLGRYRGSFGRKLARLTPEDAREALPPYARYEEKKFPEWKIEFIQKNREFYRKHKKLIDRWLPQITEFSPSFQKLEWNVKGGERRIWNYVLRFRPFARSDDYEPGPGHRVGASVHDTSRMQPATKHGPYQAPAIREDGCIQGARQRSECNCGEGDR